MNPPSSHDALAAYVQAYEGWGADLETTARFAKVIDLDSEFHFARFFLITSYANIGDRENYEQQLAAAEERSTDFTVFEQTRFKYCKLFWSDATHVERFNLQRQLVNIAPHLDTLRWNLVILTLQLNRPREAVEVLTPLLPTFRPDSDPIAWWPLDRATQAYHLLGEYEKELIWANMALERFPDIGDFYWAKARALVAMGKVDTAIQVIDECTRTDLRSATTHAGEVMAHITLELRAHGHRSKSGELALRATQSVDRQATGLDVEERDHEDLWLHSWVLRVAGRLDEARALLLELDARGWRRISVSGALGVIAARTGDHEEARRIFNELPSSSPRTLCRWRACIAANLGEKAQAVELLKEGFAEGLRYGLEDHCDVDLEPLWDYPPFQELIAPKG